MKQDRFAFAPAGRGAILLDTSSGAVLELNESAAFVWERKLSGEPVGDIVDALAARYALPLGAARHDVERVLEPPREGSAENPGEAHYERTPEGYAFSFRDELAFLLDSTGQMLRAAIEISENVAAPLLRAVAPKILALQGETVLHASAVSLGGKVIAFTGASGAGKTTTARALSAAGGAIVSEDLLWVETDGSRVMVSESGERTIGAWVAETARRLRAGGEIDCRGFGASLRRGALLPLAEIGFLDVRRRVGEGYLGRALRPWETAGLVFRNSFHGSAESQAWIRGLERAAKIGTASSGVELRLPDGLGRLELEMRRVGGAASLRS
jgi:hypothetical protein